MRFPLTLVSRIFRQKTIRWGKRLAEKGLTLLLMRIQEGRRDVRMGKTELPDHGIGESRAKKKAEEEREKVGITLSN